MPFIGQWQRLSSGAGASPPLTNRAVPIEVSRTFLCSPVLVIEDEALIAWMLESLLEDMGFGSIAITASGEEAIRAADRLHPAMVVSDINLGSQGMDGIEAAHQIMRHGAVPVIFVSGYAGPDARERIAHDVPGAFILRKPIDTSSFRKTVELAAGNATRSH